MDVSTTKLQEQLLEDLSDMHHRPQFINVTRKHCVLGINILLFSTTLNVLHTEMLEELMPSMEEQTDAEMEEEVDGR